MIKSKKTYNEMGDIFIKTGKALKKLTKGHNVSVNMDVGDIETKNDHLNCGTPACVGGWLAVLYGEEWCDYTVGADIFAEKLGFVDTLIGDGEDEDAEYYMPYENLSWFFSKNPKLWGNKDGDEMFSECYAYDEGGKFFAEADSEQFDTGQYNILGIDDIAHKFICVGKRMKKASKSKKK